MARPNTAKQRKSPGKGKAVRVKGKPGRPTKRSPEVEARIIAGLSKGVPLTIICQPEEMPHPNKVREWMAEDEKFSGDIACAREAGFDRIAMDALAIADADDDDTLVIGKEGAEIEIPNKEWILRTKLRVETRLKLLAKWDPKRYGDKVQTEISGKDGGAIRTAQEVSPELKELILQRTADAAVIAAAIQPPASLEGKERDA